MLGNTFAGSEDYGMDIFEEELFSLPQRVTWLFWNFPESF